MNQEYRLINVNRFLLILSIVAEIMRRFDEYDTSAEVTHGAEPDIKRADEPLCDTRARDKFNAIVGSNTGYDPNNSECNGY